MIAKYSKQIQTIFQRNRLPRVVKINEIKAGKVNKIFSINDRYILKFALQKNRSFQKEVWAADHLNGIPLAPLIVFDDSLSLTDKPYLIQAKLPGQNLAYLWPELTIRQKQVLFNQIVTVWKKMHRHYFPFYGHFIDQKQQFSTWKQYFRQHFQQAVECATKDGYVPQIVLTKINQYYQNNQHVLEIHPLRPCFCHNDLIFTNILVNRGKISGILDFDLSISAPLDFEFEIPLSFFRQPQFFLPDNIKAKYRQPLTECVIWLKEYYPELYQLENLTPRLTLNALAGDMEMISLCNTFGYSNQMKKTILRHSLSLLKNSPVSGLN